MIPRVTSFTSLLMSAFLGGALAAANEPQGVEAVAGTPAASRLAEPAALRLCVDLTKKLRPVSPLLNGICLNEANDTDERWADGKFARGLEEIGVGVLRFPDTTHTGFHWQSPGAPLWKDLWETNPDSPYYVADRSTLRPEAAMSVDEFVAVCREIGAEPILDVNFQSGLRYGRLADSLAESLALVKHCRANGYDVKFWRVGNEPFQYSAEELAAVLNDWVPRMKAIDPDIKILFNAANHYGGKHSHERWRRIFELAGQHIDIADMHHYWRWVYPPNPAIGPTWERFISGDEVPLIEDLRNATSSGESARALREMVKREFGRTIDVAITEWNCGPVGSYPMSSFMYAMIHAELMMQFVDGGVLIACRWPGTGPDPRRGSKASLFHPRSKEKLPPWHTARLYRDVLVGDQIEATSSERRVPVLATLAPDAATVWLMTLNKTADDLVTHIDLCGSEALQVDSASMVPAEGAVASDHAEIIHPPTRIIGQGIKLTLPAFSLTRLSITVRH